MNDDPNHKGGLGGDREANYRVHARADPGHANRTAARVPQLPGKRLDPSKLTAGTGNIDTATDNRISKTEERIAELNAGFHLPRGIKAKEV